MAAAYLLQGLGAVGLIYSCGLSMTCRIGYSLMIFYQNYKWIDYTYIVPPGSVVVSFIVVYSVLRVMKFYLEMLMLIEIGAVIFGAHLYVLYRNNSGVVSLMRSYKSNE